MYPEIAAAAPGAAAGLRMAVRHAFNAVTHIFSPGRMARRVRMVDGLDLSDGLARVHVPTLLVTGDAVLDRVVPVAMTTQYLRIWPEAVHVTLPRTGHLGLITRPAEFAGVVADFLERAGNRGGRVPRPATGFGRPQPAGEHSGPAGRMHG
jgi:pimeloyl-ACP methyl ester carboxylesterase